VPRETETPITAAAMRELPLKVEKTLRHHARGLRRGLRAGLWRLGGLAVERPVFVVGCSRAGTTLVYKTFSEAVELGTLERETHDLWASLHPPAERGWTTHAIEPERACAADRDFVARYFYAHTGRRRFVDKNNQNGLSIPYLHRLFPDARFVYVKRSPGDNLSSLIEGWHRPEEFATWSHGLPVTLAIEGGRCTRWCFFLADGWREYARASIEEVCAFQYRSMNEAILAARGQVPAAQWIEIHYEDLLRDPSEGFRRAFAAAGVGFDEQLAEHCRTVLGRPYNAFSEIRHDKWRDGPHRDKVERALPLVDEVARRMGYGEAGAAQSASRWG